MIFMRKDLRENFIIQNFKSRRVAEEPCNAYQEIFAKAFCFFRVLLQIRNILFKLLNALVRHPAGDTPDDGRCFIKMKIVAAVAIYLRENLFKQVLIYLSFI